MEFYKNMEITVITPTASERSLTDRGFSNFFRVNANDDIQSVVDAEFLVEDLGAKRIAVLYNDAGYEIEAPYLRAEIVEAGITVPMLASDGAFLAATIDEANGTAEGMYVSGFAPSPASIASAEWFEAYQADIAMEVLAEGIRKAGSLSARDIADALRAGSFETLVDVVTYQENGDLQDPQIWIYKVENGEFVQVK